MEKRDADRQVGTPERLPYTEPVLKTYGSIDSITHAAAGSGPSSTFSGD